MTEQMNTKIDINNTIKTWISNLVHTTRFLKIVYKVGSVKRLESPNNCVWEQVNQKVLNMRGKIG